MCHSCKETWQFEEYKPFPMGMLPQRVNPSPADTIHSVEEYGGYMDRLDAMQVFVRVIEKGSFSAVAKERGIGQPAVSKQISALEDELGTDLIRRTSRSMSLTDAGRDFYESASRILDDFENAASRIGGGQTAPKGLIRVTVPPT